MVFLKDYDGRRFCFEALDKSVDNELVSYQATRCSAQLDYTFIEVGATESTLPDSYTVVFTEQDAFGYGDTLTKFNLYCEETGMQFETGRHTVVVNCSNIPADTAMGRFVHDLFCTTPSETMNKAIGEEMARPRLDGTFQTPLEAIETVMVRNKFTIRDMANTLGISNDEWERIREMLS